MTPRATWRRARALHAQVPLIDGHNDYPWPLSERDVGGDFAKADIAEPVPSLMTDIPRLRKGGGGQLWSVYVPAEMQGKEAVRATLEQIDIVHRMTKRRPETFELAPHRSRRGAGVQGRADWTRPATTASRSSGMAPSSGPGRVRAAAAGSFGRTSAM